LTSRTLGQAIRDFFRGEKSKEEPCRQPWFCAQFKGKKIDDLIVVSTATKKNIQAITGATISSKALTDSVRRKAEEVLEYEHR